MPPARLIILATGGTIAVTKETAQAGTAMTLCAANLLAAVPRLAELAEVEALDVLAKPSADFTLADIAAIADAATAAAKTGAGIVITHGTDTLDHHAGPARARNIFVRVLKRNQRQRLQLLRAHSHVFPAAWPRNTKSMTRSEPFRPTPILKEICR